MKISVYAENSAKHKQMSVVQSVSNNIIHILYANSSAFCVGTSCVDV